MMKKMFIFVLLLALIAPSSVFANESRDVEIYGPGEWDLKGQKNVNFAFIKRTVSDSFIATDGGNFKIDLTSSLYSSNNYVQATIYINGNEGVTKGTPVSNYKGTIEFSGIPKGASVFFYIEVANSDTFN